MKIGGFTAYELSKKVFRKFLNVLPTSTRSRLVRRVFKISDEVDLLRAKKEEIDDIKTICVCIGPYRNMTTLTASILFLHPNIQVLNHGWKRIIGDERVDFTKEFSKEKLSRFAKFAVLISGKGVRGGWGGSITKSHAFSDKHEIKKVFENSSLSKIKKEVKCLFWKEPLRVTKRIRESKRGIRGLVENDERVRFLLPVRNPMDCAKSNLKTGHWKIFQDVHADPSKVEQGGINKYEVLDNIMGEIAWYSEMKNEYPKKFMHYLPKRLNKKDTKKIANFLKIENKKSWENKAIKLSKTKSSYEKDENFQSYYYKSVERVKNVDGLKKDLERFE